MEVVASRIDEHDVDSVAIAVMAPRSVLSQPQPWTNTTAGPSAGPVTVYRIVVSCGRWTSRTAAVHFVADSASFRDGVGSLAVFRGARPTTAASPLEFPAYCGYITP